MEDICSGAVQIIEIDTSELHDSTADANAKAAAPTSHAFRLNEVTCPHPRETMTEIAKFSNFNN